VKKELISPRNHRGGASGGTTQAVKVGNLVFVGGQMSLDESGRVIGPDIATQTRNAFDALGRVLAEAGATMADVVKHNVYFVSDDASAAAAMEEIDRVRLAYFSAPGPTTTETRVGLDREGALIQVEAIAAVGVDKQLLAPAGHWRSRRPLPFSHGWKVGDIIFVGGQRSLDQEGRVLGAGDIAVQTANAFRNLETVLKEGDGDRNNLMRQNTYYRFFAEGRNVTDYWEKMTRVRMQYMSMPSAAGTGVRISGFPHVEELIQVEGIGVLGRNKQRLMPPNHWDWSIPDNKFTQGWRIGDLVFVGGQISADAMARAVGSDMATQTRNVFSFIRNTLCEAGLDESHVVKLNTYYYADGDWPRIAATAATIAGVQRDFYPDPPPASTSVRVSGFAFEDLLIEIEAIAVAAS
jgi:enamine deaminase RidA (YjgF/YER057c/UK114 family)